MSFGSFGNFGNLGEYEAWISQTIICIFIFFQRKKRANWPPSNLVCDFFSKIIFRINESFQDSLFYFLVIRLLFYLLMIEITTLFHVCFILRLYCKFVDTYNTSLKTTFCPKCIPVFAVFLHSYLCLTFFLLKSTERTSYAEPQRWFCRKEWNAILLTVHLSLNLSI